MSSEDTIYILGSGAIGFPLAAYLAQAGRAVIAVRTSRDDVPRGTITVAVHNEAHPVRTSVETVSLSRLSRLDGTIVIASKSYANSMLARELAKRSATGPIVIMQNGIGVERPFLEAQFPLVYRCILYVTSQTLSEYEFSFRPVTSSPIGSISGEPSILAKCVEDLTTDGLPFRAEANIQREIWKKAIINAVFNSICPLLDIDNGAFARDAAIAGLAGEVVGECVALADRLGLGLGERELMEQILLISRRSDGQLISTLQDIRAGRPTEIASLNLEMARVAADMRPPLALPRVELLGKMILAKSSRREQ
jgi:2-dehydropantoate 2-reductase